MKRYKLFRLLVAAGLAAILLVPGMALAKDAVRAKVENYGSNGFVVENGAFQTPGTYAVGTIKVNYNIIGDQFLADQVIRTFNLCMDVIEGKAKPATAYPATVNLAQVGTPDVNLNLSNSSVVFANSEDGPYCVEVSVSVPGTVANDPDFQADGTELVANLQLSTPPKTHLDTVTTVKVHMTLVHPTETAACIVPLHLVANQNFDTDLSDVGAFLSYQTNTTTLSSTPNDFQHLIALVNTCEDDIPLDLATAINDNFELHQANAVRTTAVAQEFVDLDALLGYGLNWDTLSNAGTNLCLEDIVVPGGETFIIAERARIKASGYFPGTYASSIGRGLGAWSYNGFTFAAHEENAGGCGTGELSLDVEPNEGEVSIPINQVSFTGPGAPGIEVAPE